MCAHMSCHICILIQANQTLSLFSNITSLVIFFWTPDHSQSFSASPPFLKFEHASEHATSAEALLPLNRPEGLLLVSYSLFF